MPLTINQEFEKHLFIKAVEEVAGRWDKFPVSAAQKNASFAVGLTVFDRGIKVLNEPWMTGRYGWSVLLDHPEFGQIRISSENFATVEA